MRRKKKLLGVIAIALTGFFLFAYFVPFVYVGAPNSAVFYPPPELREYVSLTCAVFVYHLPILMGRNPFSPYIVSEFAPFGTAEQGDFSSQYHEYSFACSVPVFPVV